MLVVGFAGTELSADAPILEQIKSGLVGNVILFEIDGTLPGKPIRNIESPGQLKNLITALKSASTGALPLWVAIDQEGGKVQRLRQSRGFLEDYPSAKKLGEGALAETHAAALRMGKELAALGVDLNFAPVADIDVNPSCPVIGALGRSFGSDPYRAAEHIMAFGKGLAEAGVVPCLKHFPGHGSAEADTHDGAADITKTWQEAELVPYRQAIDSGWPGIVMSSHVYHADLDPHYPTSISHRITTGLLREKLGWNGVVITDDLQMKALLQHYSMEESIYLAISAGADMLIFSGNARGTTYAPDLPARAHAAIVNLVRSGKISETRLLESWKRIAACKKLHATQCQELRD